MAIAQQGTWGIGPFKLPDFGLTEGRGLGDSFNNPAVYNQGALFQPALLNPSPNSGQVQGASTYTPPTTPTPLNPNYNPSSGGGTSGAQQTQPTQSGQQVDSGANDLNSELDNIFNPVLSALQGQENTLNQNLGQAVTDINSQYGVSQASLSQQNKQGMAELNAQGTEAGTRKEDALTSATRLYNELQRGGQQRFGGASSAGEAYQTLTATEQQRRQGTIQSAYETAMQQVGQYKTNLQEKYNVALQDLESQKNAAIGQAQTDFRNALQQINAARNQVAADRAAASQNVLQDLRNKVYTINQQSLQFAQQLAANQQLSMKAVDDYTAKMNSAISSSQVIGTNFANQAQATAGATNYGIASSGQSAPTTQTGAVTKKWQQDENGNWVMR